MSKATPIPDGVTCSLSGAIEYGSCMHCGVKIYRVKGRYELLWLHDATSRTRCGEKSK